MKIKLTQSFQVLRPSVFAYEWALLFLVLVTGACQSTSDGHKDHSEHNHPAAPAKEGPVAILEKQVLATHDSIMPTMSELMKLRKAVSEKTASQPAGQARELGLTISGQLKEADAVMMDWMHQYNGDTLGKLDEAKALTYLRDQQVRVNQVRDKMRRSMASAQTYLDQKP